MATMRTCHRLKAVLAAMFAVSFGSVLLAQAPDPALEQRFAALKESVAKNQEALRQFTWTETTEISLKGEVKTRRQNEVRYGPDGKLVKTPLGAAPQQKQKRGLRGKIVEGKLGELKDYVERAGSLIQRYVSPDAASMTEAFRSGRASFSRDATGDGAVIIFTDYVKPGDQMTLEFRQGAIASLTVKSYLDEPADAVNLSVNFQKLSDGTNYVAETVLNAVAKSVDIRITNFDHHR